jgi:hypothetical protein
MHRTWIREGYVDVESATLKTGNKKLRPSTATVTESYFPRVGHPVTRSRYEQALDDMLFVNSATKIVAQRENSRNADWDRDTPAPAHKKSGHASDNICRSRAPNDSSSLPSARGNLNAFIHCYLVFTSCRWQRCGSKSIVASPFTRRPLCPPPPLGPQTLPALAVPLPGRGCRS